MMAKIMKVTHDQFCKYWSLQKVIVAFKIPNCRCENACYWKELLNSEIFRWTLGDTYIFVVTQSLSHIQLFVTHELQHTRLPCLSLSPWVCSNSCPLSQWCHPTIYIHACLITQTCLTLCNTIDCSLPGSSVHGFLQARNTRVGCHSLPQGIFPGIFSVPGIEPSLLHCRRILHHLSR